MASFLDLILSYFSSFFCFSSCLACTSFIYCMVFFPVRCHSGTFAGFLLVLAFSCFFGSVTKSIACTSIGINRQKNVELKTFYLDLKTCVN